LIEHLQFFADFQHIFSAQFVICVQLAQITRNLRNLRAQLQIARDFNAFSAQISSKFCANFSFFPRDFLQRLYRQRSFR